MGGVRVFVVGFGLMAMMAGAAGAQSPGSGADPIPPVAVTGVVVPAPPVQLLVGSGRLGATAEPLVTSETVLDETRSRLAMAAAPSRSSTGLILMLVGLAAVVTGVLTEEHAIAIGGAAVGLIGFYLYVR